MLKTLIASASDVYAKPEAVRKTEFTKINAALTRYARELAAMFSEPYILDDSRRVTLKELIAYLATQCDTLICKDGDKTVGICVFGALRPGRDAEFIGWIAPEYRNPFSGKKIRSFWIEDVLPHAFNKLGLTKFYTKCCIENLAAINFAGTAGFKLVGVSRLDYQIQGQLFDSVVLEYINPACEVSPVEEKVHDGRHSKGTSSESVPDGNRNEQPESIEQFSEQRDELSERSEYAAESGSGDESSGKHDIEREPGTSNVRCWRSGQRAAVVHAVVDEQPAVPDA